MKKRVSNKKSLLLSLLLFVAVSFSLSAQDARKEISKTYDVKKGFTLNVDTKYSDVEVLTWDKDVLDVLIVIETEAASKEKAESLLKKITVDISEGSNEVTFKTEIESNVNWNNKNKMDIKYTVKLPSYLNVSLDNKYGDAYIQELAGLANLNIQYGNLKVNKLSRGNAKPYNSLNIAYGNAEIEEVAWLDLNVSYSDFETANGEMLFVESKYSKVFGERAGSIITAGKYDKYIFDEIDNFVAEVKYSNIKFGKLNKKFKTDASYTNVKIETLSKSFEQVGADLSYGNFTMGTEPGTAFNLKAESKYGGIDIAPEGKLSKVKENSYVKMWGTVGSGGKAEVDLVTRYGNITIN